MKMYELSARIVRQYREQLITQVKLLLFSVDLSWFQVRSSNEKPFIWIIP